MKTLQSVVATLRGWMGFRSGIRTSAPAGKSKSTQSDDGSNVEPIDIPVDCPSTPDLRIVAAWLASHFPAAAALDLVRAKDYTAAHELVGAHDAIQAILTLADDVDAAQEDALRKEAIGE